MVDDFIGMPGSREDQIEEIVTFLGDSKSGYCQVVGAWGVGKTRIIEKARAIAESRSIKFYSPPPSDGYVKLSVDAVRNLVARRRDGQSQVSTSRFKLTELIEEIEDRARPGEVVLLWVRLKGLGRDHNLLAQICRPGNSFPPTIGRSIKFVFESRQEIELGWEEEWGSDEVMPPVKVVRFDKDEAKEFLIRQLEPLIDLRSNGCADAVRSVVCRYVGYHPRLLWRLCRTLCSPGRRFVTSRLNGHTSVVDAIGLEVQNLFDGGSRKAWAQRVNKLVASLPTAALKSTLGRCAAKNSDGPNLFISYSHRDLEVVEWLHERLIESGVNVWRDEGEGDGGIRVGDQIPDAITDAIDRCDFFLVVWSEEASKSKWVRSEINYAITRRMRRDSGLSIILVRVEKAEVPGMLGASKNLDLFDREHGFRKLIEAILPGYPERFHPDLDQAGLVVRESEREQLASLVEMFRSLVEAAILRRTKRKRRGYHEAKNEAGDEKSTAS